MESFKEWLNENEDIEIPPYKDGEDINRWQWKTIDLIAQKRIPNEQFVSIYVPTECLNNIKNFPNKNIMNEIMNVSDSVLRGMNEKSKIDQIQDQINKAYKLHFVNSFDCIKSSCNNLLEQMRANKASTPIPGNEILKLHKKDFISLSKWASVSRSFGYISDCLGKASDGELSDYDWEDFYYANQEIKNIFPVLNNIVNSI